MRLKEIFEKAAILHDSKARRRSNLSSKVADITADEIEAGITIERLESINVPVMQYQTQITIHGTLPDIKKVAVCGYQSVIQNKNGSVGVKYLAIDGAKKQLILQVARRAKDRKFGCRIDSQGMTLSACYHDKQACLQAYRAFPDNLIVGSKVAGQGMYGEYYVIVNVSAIYQENVWPFLKAVYNITESEYEAILENDKKESDAIIARQKKEAENKAMLLEQAKKTAPYKRINVVPETGSFFALGMSRAGNPEFYHYNIIKNKGKKYYSCFLASKELYSCKYLDQHKQGVFESYARDGRLYV